MTRADLRAVPIAPRAEDRTADQEGDGTLDATLLRIRAVTTWPEGRRGGTYALETWYLWGQNQ